MLVVFLAILVAGTKICYDLKRYDFVAPLTILLILKTGAYLKLLFW